MIAAHQPLAVTLRRERPKVASLEGQRPPSFEARLRRTPQDDGSNSIAFN